MWLPGKLPLKKYLHDERRLNWKKKKKWGGMIKAESFPHNPPELVHRCARVMPTEQARN